ncbi:outer membrane beta-barrel protein [uncultured Legionella sp.]|uniref:outer membrane protein n=1 Tax=uncultured Legionella sp. TaxID=210934 RepID=UPI0026352B41|nr:outer membrane beta-barrel protein [uncultured Legionella sp.]
MKQLIKLGLLTNLLLSSSAFAVNPESGFYLGLLGEVSTGPTDYQLSFTDRTTGNVYTGTVNNSRIGGGGGAMLGYRYYNFRIEGEFLYNRYSSGSIRNNDCILYSPVSNSSICGAHSNLGFSGSVAAMYGLANVYWDFINYESDNGSVFPYVGLGVGHARVTTRGEIVKDYYFVNTKTSKGTSNTYSSNAAQGILGVGLFMDDFTWAGMDYRYLTTNTLKDFGNKRYAINSLNFTVSLSFDKSRT